MALGYKKNEIIPFTTTWMDLEILILSEVSQTEKDKYHDVTYTWKLKYDTNELIYKIEIDSDTENKFTVTKKETREGNKLGIWN